MYLARQRQIKKQILLNKQVIYRGQQQALAQRQNEKKQRQTKLSKKSQSKIPTSPKPTTNILISDQSLCQLQQIAHDQLSMQKVISRQIQYHCIEMFLLFANTENKQNFYRKVSQSLRDIFNNQKAKKVFDQKWTHTLKSNVMALFYTIVKDYYTPQTNIRPYFNTLYYQAIDKLMKDDKLSRIEEKFLDTFLSQAMKQQLQLGIGLQVLGAGYRSEIHKVSNSLQKLLNQKQTPKSLSNSQYLQYSVFSLLNFSLPHEKYLYNQLLHAPNPKYLYPFRKKGTFTALTNQILSKSNKIDMIGFKFWSIYQYQQTDIYEKVRKAAEWEQRVLPLAIMLKKKVIKGLERYINLIDQKVRNYNHNQLQQDSINLLNSYVELCLQICHNQMDNQVRMLQSKQSIKSSSSLSKQGNNLSKFHQRSPQSHSWLQRPSNSIVQPSLVSNSLCQQKGLSSVLSRIDLCSVLQSQNISFKKESKLKYFTTKLTQLYFILLINCPKYQLRQKFIKTFAISIQKILINQNDRKFTQDIIHISIKYLQMLTYDQRHIFVFQLLEKVNQQWESVQAMNVTNQITKIDKQLLQYLSFIIQKFGLDDHQQSTKKVLKLQFFYILALNFNQNEYFQSKKRLSKCKLTINVNLSNNSIFSILQIRKLTQQKFKQHLKRLYGDYSFQKKQHEGILAIIDQILTYRIQVSKDFTQKDQLNHHSYQYQSFYSVLINFLEEAERLDPSKKLLNIVKNYCQKCKKTYFIQVNQMKFKDETKKRARQLITQDVSFLVQASISSNPIIAQFSQQILFFYIQQISQLAFYTRILIVFSQCITILYKKASTQYESKAQILKGKNLTSSILIPTDNKIILKRLARIMIALYKIVLKGHCIDDNYIRIKIGYLIKQYSKSAKTPFGWKYLKYLCGNFKQDKQFISKQILTNNSCSWFINQRYFSRKIRQMKPQKLLVDKYLLPLHQGECTSTELKKLLTNIDVQQQTQFLIIPAKGTQQSFVSIIQDLQSCCQQIQQLQLSSQKQQVDSPYRGQQTVQYKSKSMRLQQLQNNLYNIISRIKMTYITKLSQIQIFSSIFQICKKYNNSELLKYILVKIVPFAYCINQFNQRILILISEMLYYVVNQLNKTTKFVYNHQQQNSNHQQHNQQYHNKQYHNQQYHNQQQHNQQQNNQQNKQNKQNKQQVHNTFDLLLNCFQGLQQYQIKQHSKSYEQLYNQTVLSNSNKIIQQKSYKFMVIKFYTLRLSNLRRMFKQLQKFLSENMHVCIGKGFALSLIVQIFSINFILDDQVMEFLHLQSICYCLTSQLELVNVLKSSLEKGQTSFEQRTMVQEFQQQTLKMGLNHFQRRHNFYRQELLNQTHNIKSLKTKIDFLIQICDYLRNQDFHQLRKKKLPKKSDKIFIKNKKQSNLFNQISDQGMKKPLSRLHHTSLASQHGQTFQIYNKSKKPIIPIQSTQNQFYDPGALRFTLLYLISQQIDKTKAYSFSDLCDIQNPYCLGKKKGFVSSQMILSTYAQMGQSNVLIYNLLKIFGNRIDDPQLIQKELADKITQFPDHGFPQFLDIFIQSNKDKPQRIKQINFWKAPNIQILFKYLHKDYQQYSYLQQFVTKILSRLHSDQILFYLPQIFQALTLKSYQIIYQFLLQYARQSASFAHQLIWIAKVQSKQQQDPHNKNVRLSGVEQNLNKLRKVAKNLITDVLRQFTKEEKVFFREVNDFYQEVTAISAKMKPQQPKDVKKDIIRAEVEKILIPQSAYLPINPLYKVVDIDKESGIPMQSAAKCPFLLTFRCKKYEGPDKDFQNRKKLKKSIQYQEYQQEFDVINDQQQSHQLPIFNTVSSRSPYAQKPATQISQPSVLKPRSPYQSLSLNQIHLSLSQHEQVTPTNKNKKETPVLFKQKIISNKSILKQKTGASQLINKEKQNLIEFSCIYKVFDDIRQDCLALQVIRLFMEIFQRHNLQLKLFSYKTISNRTGPGLDIGGIIQVVPKTVSRDSIGKTNEQSLYEFFISNFGPQYNERFQQARQNFIKSQAGYSIVSYILQIKDRHNGNILINTQQGYLVHIDFGFIFDISPANNLKFQKADFKLTQQMIKIMGGSLQSEPFQLYLNLVIKGFLISRRYSQHIINVIKQMYASGLPCFLQKSIDNLRARFVLELSQFQAAEYMKDIVYKAADNWFTNWYDKIQWFQQKIYH